MENEIASNIKRKLTTKKFNAYRIFTKVLYLLDIYNANGNALDPKLIKYSISTNKNSRLTQQTKTLDLLGQPNPNMQRFSGKNE